MAIYGNIQRVKNQVNKEKFKVAFDYLEKVIQNGSIENNRLKELPLKAFNKVDLNENTFALEQVYNSKNREECFFESHKKYIDVQFILEGEEIIEIEDINNLQINEEYVNSMDLIKYKDRKEASSLVLKANDVAIFFPEDAHMPCLKLNENKKVIKTVIKVEV